MNSKFDSLMEFGLEMMYLIIIAAFVFFATCGSGDCKCHGGFCGRGVWVWMGKEMFHCQEGEEQIHGEEWSYRSEMDSKYTQ